MSRIRLLAVLALSPLLGGCAAVMVAGLAAGAAVSVTTTAVGLGVKATGAVAGTALDLVTGGSDKKD